MDCAVVHDFFVDFIGKNHQVVLAGDFGDFLQHFFAVHRACGVVGVDDNDGFGFAGDFGFDVGDVGHPASGFVAQIMAHFAACERGGGCPQRIIGRGNQDFVAIVEQGLHTHQNQLGHAIADVYIVGIQIKTARLIILHDGLPRGEQPFAVAIALRSGKMADDVFDDAFGGFKTERSGVADIEFDDLMPCCFHFHGFLHDWATDFITNVF